jgi:signal transduction histidine kinase
VKGSTDRSKKRGAARVVASPPRWPSEAEQTLEALRAGLIDALVIPKGRSKGVYALKTFEELEQANSQLRDSQQHLLLLLREHERLMQDLHDGCIQTIYAVGLGLEDCRGLIEEDPAEASRKVAHAQASLNLVIQELRAFISGMQPEAIDLAREISRVVEGIGERGPRFEIDISKALVKRLPQGQAKQLLQIAREALSNIVRHADAESARITLRQRGGKVRFEVVDDGKGFEKARDNGSGLGLHHIAARVQKLGGRLTLDSRPARGCRMLIELAV